MEKYKDIIGLPHRQSTKRARMPLLDRAAQFAPFAALTGYDDAIRETGRLTDEKIDVSEETKSALNRKFRLLADLLGEENEALFTYFVPDEAKSGGAYITKRGVVKKVDDFERLIVLYDGTKISMDNVLTIEGDVFDSVELL